MFWYNAWSGRYTSLALLNAFNPLLSGSIAGYRVLSAIMIIGLLCCFFLLVRAFLPKLTAGTRIVVAAFLGAIYFSLLPHLCGTVYWMTGALHHAVPTMLVALSLALYAGREKRLWLRYLVLPPLTFLIVGCNETIMLIWMALLFLGNACRAYAGKKLDPLLGLLLVAGAVGFCLVYFAPGNAVRGSEFSNAHRPFYTLSHTVVYMAVHTVLFASVPFALFLWWTAKNARRIQDAMEWRWISRTSLKMTVVLYCVVLFFTFFTALWAKGGKPPAYVYSMTLLFYVPLIPLIVLQAALLYPSRFGFLERFPISERRLLALFCLLFILLGNNGRALYDVVWTAPKYHGEVLARYDLIRAAQGKDLVVRPFRYRPRTIYYDDVEKDPGNYKNETYARYFGLKSIVLER
jgi:hypothetical protein